MSLNPTLTDEAELKRYDPLFQVTLEDREPPQTWPGWRKWTIAFVVSSSGFCVTCLSSIASMTVVPISNDFQVPRVVATLGITLFVQGLGLGPLLIGPLSEVYGRNITYRVSYALLILFSFGVTFSPNIAVFLVFRFITGLCGSAFLSVAGGTMSDLFVDEQVAMPMALFTVATFCGPIAGPLMGGFINQNLHWRWTYRIMQIWSFGQLIMLLLIPETFTPVLLKKKARRLRKTEKRPYWAPTEAVDYSLKQAIIFSCKTPFKLLMYERMVLVLDIWSALILGILYLSFQSFPIVFQEGHGFSVSQQGMTFLGIGFGMVSGVGVQALIQRRARRIAKQYDGKPPPETRLFGGQIGGVLIAVSLFTLAFTTPSRVHWIAPIIASVPFGTGAALAYVSTFTYLVTAYRPIAASAMASNSAVRSTFGGVFPLFATAMYRSMGTVGATLFLAALAGVMAPAPFLFAKYGARLRSKSRFAVQSDVM